VNLSEGETRALLASTVLVLLAALARVLLSPPAAEVRAERLDPAGGADSALAAAESVYVETRRRSQPLATGERIDPNTADEAELDRLPGVGPALAREIVRNRRIEGPFRSLGDLERVPGLGSSKVERLVPYVRLPAGAATEAAKGDGGGGISDSEGRGSRIDLNRATVLELQALPGIGPVRARAIIRWREEHGRFRNFPDLSEVPGVGPATVWKLRSLVVIRP
jgi:competence protein ComEA